MKNIKRFMIITLIVISTLILPIVSGATSFDLTVFEVNNAENTVTGSGVIHTNADNNVKIEWNAGTFGDFDYFEVLSDFANPGGISIPLNASRIQSTSWTILAAGLPDEGTYHLQVNAYDISTSGVTGFESQVVTLVIDKTTPAAPTSFLIKNSEGSVITDSIENVSQVKLEWTDGTSGDQPYRVFYIKPNGTPEEITDIANISGDATGLINIGPGGLDFLDSLITFQVTVTDEAYNQSVVEEVSFTLDTNVPGEVRELEIVNGATEIGYDEFSNAITKLRWLAPSTGDATSYNISWKLDTGGFSGLATVSGVLEYNFPGNTEVDDTDGKITFKVTAVDIAGNNSTGITTQFNLDTVAPIFDVTFINSEDQIVTDIHSGVLNFVEKKTISVNNVLNDIDKFSVAAVENYVSGDRDDLQEFLRNLSVDGLYNVYIMDEAGNKAFYTFHLAQQFPTIPSNDNLTITSLDTEELIGVQSNVSVSWVQSTDSDLDHYKLFINGEEVATGITNSGIVGEIVNYQFTLDTIKYGDVENYYEVRTYDDIGNYGSYDIRKHITEDLVKPASRILTTSSTETEISFMLDLVDFNRILDDVNAVLYKGSKLIEKIPVTVGVHTYYFGNLEDGESDYRIKIEADYDFNSVEYDNDVLNEVDLYNLDTLTSSNDVLANIIIINVDESSVTFELDTTKVSVSDESFDVKIYADNVLEQTIDVDLDTDILTTVRALNFTSLTTGVEYQIRVVDGTDVIATANFFTQKDVPTTKFLASEIEGEAMSVRITISDDDGAISGADSKYARIYLDGEMIQEIAGLSVGSNNITFTNLDFYTEYEIKIFTSYDLSNGRGKITNDQIGLYMVSTAKEAPEVEFRNVEITDNSIVFDSYIDDDYYSIVSVKAVLYQGINAVGKEILLNKGTLRNREFSSLDSLTNYRINIEIVYDLKDGNGHVINELFYGINAITLKSLPSVEVTSITSDNSSITVVARIIDDNSSYENGLIKLFSNTQIPPVDMFTFSGTGVKTFVFSNLDPDKIYRIKVDAEIDLNDGEGMFDLIIYTKEVITKKNIAIDIIAIDGGTDQVSFSANVLNFLSENIYAKLYRGDDLVGSAVAMVAGDNDVVFQDLEPDTVYTIKVEYSNGTKDLWEYQILTDSILELIVPTLEIVEETVEGNIVTLKIEVNDPDNALTSQIVQIRTCNEIGLCTVQEINVSILETGLSLVLPYEINTIELNMSYNTIKQTGTATDSTEQITVEDEPDPVDPIDPGPEEPIDPDDEVGFFQKIWNWIKSLFGN